MSESTRRSGRPQRTKWITTSALIGVLLLGMALRLWGLDAKSLWQDEIFTAAIASPENGTLEVITIPLYNKALPGPPLYFLITHYFLFLGDNDFLLRFPALAFGLLGLAATFTLGARLFGEVEGIVGALLVALAPFHVRYSQDARFYTLLVLLSLLSVYFLYRGLSRGKWTWFVGFVICSILNLYNHLFAFLVLASQVVFVAGLWAAQARGRMRKFRPSAAEEAGPVPVLRRNAALAFLVSLMIIALAYAPMVPHLLRGLSGAKGVGSTGGETALDPSFLMVTLDSWGLGSGWRILVLAVPFALGVMASARGQRKQLWLACCWILVPFGTLLIVPAGHGFRPRYVLFMLPLYLILAARGLTAVSGFVSERSSVPRHRLAFVVLAVLLGALTLLSVPALWAYYGEDRVDWRSVAALVAEKISPRDVIVSPGQFPEIVLRRYEKSLEGATFLIGGSEVFLSPEEEREGGVWFVGPAREKMEAIDLELAQAGEFVYNVVFEVDDESSARGRALKIAPAMYDDLWVLYVREGLQPEDVAGL
jgi:mannosyltransferase